MGIFTALPDALSRRLGKGCCCCGFATADAEDGRSASIAASRGGGAEGIVACLGGILA